jgi:hypothetical protein
MISVIGQGSGSPRGFGLFRIINVESTIRRNPDMAKHIFDIFNIITSLSWILINTIKFASNKIAIPIWLKMSHQKANRIAYMVHAKSVNYII